MTINHGAIKLKFICTPSASGASISIEKRGFFGHKSVEYCNWKSNQKNISSSLRFLDHALNANEVDQSGDTLTLPSEFIFNLPAAISASLNIPHLAAISAKISMRGRLDSKESQLNITWQDHNTRMIVPQFQGPFIKKDDKWQLLSKELYSLNLAAENFNNTAGQDFELRLPFWKIVQDFLQSNFGQNIKADQFVGSLTIYQSSAFALDVRETPNGPDFVPVLMARDGSADLADSDDDGSDAPETDGDNAFYYNSTSHLKSNENDALLLSQLQAKFTEEVSNRAGSTQPAYVLDRNTYLLIDAPLRVALDAIKAVRSLSSEIRKEFLKNPRTLLAKSLGEDSEGVVSRLFVETTQYSERVQGLGLWEKPKLSWLTRKANQWLPESFAVQIGKKTINATLEIIQEIEDVCTNAEQDQSEELTYENEVFATSNVRTMLTELEKRLPGSEPRQSEENTDKAAVDNNVLLIADNLDDLGYSVGLKERKSFGSDNFPTSYINGTNPKQHQIEGFSWLREGWKQGWPGVLLADDMGLGKTFQALAFLAWIKENKALRKGRQRALDGPFLIVAPTSLLDNWKKEADIHLKPGVLGVCIDAFGSHLKHYKNAQSLSKIDEDALDIEQMRQADWILTTYETLAIYHRSFARIGYSVAIFDEMQKIKSPDTINSHAAKTMNIDFVLGMTGTPIENRLEDLWCIMDRIASGYLGDLKTFSHKYGTEDPDALRELKQKMDQKHETAPPIMLRRMKSDVAKDLPEKIIKTYDTPMSPAQVDAYNNAIIAAKASDKSPRTMLETLHLLRGISLHPEKSEHGNAYDNTWRNNWICSSARLSKTFSLLEMIHDKGHKALIFLEDRALQQTLSIAIAEHFNLTSKPPIINGTVMGKHRLQIVETFQNKPDGFDVLILSPKAAGIGLTITAANHVIHLSRWWNPAVEDQCNDRAFRIGQTKNVHIHLPLAIHPQYGPASFDVKLDHLLDKKRILSRDMLAPPTSDRDVNNLFSDIIGEDN